MTAPNPAADVRQMIEDVQARHVETEGGQCRSCHVDWPCETARLADTLEQAVTVIEAADRLADAVAEPWHSIGETIKPVYPTAAAWQEYRDARETPRRMAGGE